MNTVCNTVKVKNTNRGGRLYSAILPTAIENGSVVFLGELVANETEIRNAVVPTTALIAKETPMLVMTPEVIYDESTLGSGALGNFKNPANKSFPVIPLEAFDEIELSAEGFVGTPAVGKYAVLANGSTKFTIEDVAPTTGCVLYGKITSSRKSALPTFLGGTGTFFPSAYDLFNVEFIAL